VEGVVMRVLLIAVTLSACMPDLSGIPAVAPCGEEPIAWSDADWQDFYTSPSAIKLLVWQDAARCRVYLLRHLGHALTTDTIASAEQLQGRSAEMQLQTVALKDHLLKLQASTWRSCRCDPSLSCEHIADASGDPETLDPLCEGTLDRSLRLLQILDHMIDHAQRAVQESAIDAIKVHGEHVLNCIQSGGEEDWDLDGDGEQVCVGELNDYGLIGDGPGDLIRLQAEQVRQHLVP